MQAEEPLRLLSLRRAGGVGREEGYPRLCGDGRLGGGHPVTCGGPHSRAGGLTYKLTHAV